MNVLRLSSLSLGLPTMDTQQGDFGGAKVTFNR